MPLPSRGKHSITRTISAGPGKRLTAGAFSAIPPTSSPARPAFPTAASLQGGRRGHPLVQPPLPAVLRTHTTLAAIPIQCPQPLLQAPLRGARLRLLRPPHWQPLAAMCPRTATRSWCLQRREPSGTWAATSSATPGTTTWTCPYSRTSTSPSVSAPSCDGRSSTYSIFPSPPIPLAHPALSIPAIPPVRVPCSAL